MSSEITADEKRAISTLKRLAKRWPDSLWLYSTNGTLCVMKKGSDGRRQRFEDDLGFDQAATVATIDIENDGGDW